MAPRARGSAKRRRPVAAAALAPAILGGFTKQAQTQPAGLDGLVGLLGGHGGGGLLDEVLAPRPTDVSAGNDVLGQIFGSEDVSRTVARDAAGAVRARPGAPEENAAGAGDARLRLPGRSAAARPRRLPIERWPGDLLGGLLGGRRCRDTGVRRSGLRGGRATARPRRRRQSARRPPPDGPGQGVAVNRPKQKEASFMDWIISLIIGVCYRRLVSLAQHRHEDQRTDGHHRNNVLVGIVGSLFCSETLPRAPPSAIAPTGGILRFVVAADLFGARSLLSLHLAGARPL